MKPRIWIIFVLIILAIAYLSVYTVDERMQVIITQFGKPIGDPIKEPGLKVKFPWRTKTFFPKNLLEWDGDPGRVPTADKTYLWVDTFARWKIVDPLLYFQKVTNEVTAQSRLDAIINSAIRNYVTSYPLIETVRNTNRELDITEEGVEKISQTSPLGEVSVGRGKIANGILEQAQPKLEQIGIKLVDVKIKRLDYVDEVRDSVYGRMIAERKQIAEKFRSEGKGEARKIEGDMEKELKRITSEAYRKAEEIKGKADAEATQIYARAFGKDPDFYSFIQTLEIYKQTMNKDSSLILSTDSEFLKYFKGYKGE